MNQKKIFSLLFLSFIVSYFHHIPTGYTCVEASTGKIKSLIPACQSISTTENQWDDRSVYQDFTKRIGYYCNYMQKRVDRIEALGSKADKKRAARRFWYNYRTFRAQFSDLKEMADRHMIDPDAKGTVTGKLASLQSSLNAPIEEVNACFDKDKRKKKEG